MSAITSLTATSSALPPLGFYVGKLTAIEDAGKSTGKYGEQHQVRLIIRLREVFSLDDPDSEEAADEYIGTDLWAFANLMFTPRSKLRGWCSEIAGREIEDGEDFDVNEIIGRDVRVHIGKNTEGNPSVQGLTRYIKPKAKKRPKPEPESEDDFEDEDETDEDDF